MSIVYEAFFVQNVLISKLYKNIEFKHITTEFKPVKSHEHLYGTEATFIITGYGNDGANEGYKVQLVSCDSNELVELYRNILLPHITLSVSKEGKPINTNKLHFKEVKPFLVKTKFGAFTEGNQIDIDIIGR